MESTNEKFDLISIRKEFPLLSLVNNGNPIIYFDNGSTTQKPRQVIDTIHRYYENENSNIHRAQYQLSINATEKYEQSRKTVQKFINANDVVEIIFTKGTTESINLVASCFGKTNLEKDDEIIVSIMEHHANIVPWQIICTEKSCHLKVIPINEKGELIISEFEKLMSSKTKLVAISHVSNMLGTINPVKKIIDIAHRNNIPVLVDGAQAVSHSPVDVAYLDCDFYTFSSHKLFGPTGVGVLYGKKEWLNKFPPYQTGGDMIKNVSFNHTTYADLPQKFEAGTPNISGVLGLAAAIDYINSIGFNNIHNYETSLLAYVQYQLLQIEGLKIIGKAEEKASIISFIIEGIHPSDIGILLDKMGVCIRTGQHCTGPLMDYLGISGTARVSFAFYNTIEEIDEFIKALKRVVKILKR